MSGDKDIDDQIPEDDDMDLGGDYEESPSGEDEFADEDWDAYDDEAAAGEEAGPEDGAPKKKSSSNFNKIVIAGGVLLGVCVLAFQMMTGAPPQTATTGATQTQQAADDGRRKLTSASLTDNAPTTQREVIYGLTREDTETETAPEDTAVSGGLLHDQNEVRKVEDRRRELEEELEAADAQYAAQEAAEAQEQVPTAPPADSLLPAETPEVVDADPPMPVPAQETMLTPLPSDEAPASVGLPRAQDLTLADDTGMETPAVADPFAADGTLVEDTPVDVTSSSETTPEADPAEVEALNRRIEELMAQVESMQEEIAKVDDLKSTVQQLERALESRTAPQRSTTPKSSQRRKAADTAASRQPSAPWVLKSAQPGRAMVGRAGDSAVRSVTVGDSLPGIGRILQIYEGGTGWVVEGTNGKVTQ